MHNSMNFQDILASAVHDIKNSLGMLLHMIDEVRDNCIFQNCSSNELYPNLQYEARRANNDLIQLLTLYKIGNSRLPLNVSHLQVSDFIGEHIIQNKPLLDAKGIEIKVECPEDMFFFFDRELISGVLNSILNNAFRYAGNRIAVIAAEENGDLVISINDDGEGYPPNMLCCGNIPRVNSTDFKTGSTGLGLYFASMVAGMHENKGRNGFITVTNGGKYQGGCFAIHLP